jgi:hypothetical protein
MKMVKVQIEKDGHYHAGKLCEPGDIIEVTPRQSAFLLKIGTARPVQPPRKTRSKASEPEQETPQEETTEGAEETPETS